MDLNRLTNEAYNAYVKAKAKPSPMGKNLVWAFLVGGGICLVGQALLDGYASLGLDLTQAKTAVSITLIFVTALLTGIGVFDRFAKHAGAGTLVPITGFANAVVAPAMEFKQEGMITGTAAKLFTALAENRINVRMIDQGSSELNIIVGVDMKDFENAIRAIYRAFVE